MEQKGLLKLLCSYPESAGLEDHLQMIKSEIKEFKPSRNRDRFSFCFS